MPPSDQTICDHSIVDDGEHVYQAKEKIDKVGHGADYQPHGV